MSSYFDTMAECMCNQEAVAKLAWTQYLSYLTDLQENVISKDEEKLGEFVVKFLDMTHKCEGRPRTMLSVMHDLAHELGSMGIKMKDGSYAGDNPRLPY